MIHPSTMSVEYIWNRFSEVWLCENTRATMKLVDSIQKRMAHIPLNDHSAEFMSFQKKLKEDILSLKNKHPHFKF